MKLNLTREQAQMMFDEWHRFNPTATGACVTEDFLIMYDLLKEISNDVFAAECGHIVSEDILAKVYELTGELK